MVLKPTTSSLPTRSTSNRAHSAATGHDSSTQAQSVPHRIGNSLPGLGRWAGARPTTHPAPSVAAHVPRRLTAAPCAPTPCDTRCVGDGFGEHLSLRECRHFVNLTNGIEALPMLHELQLPYSFIRIQSTACEQQNLEALMAELDANFLISLALGHCCLVYDCGSRGREGTPRALWYGLEFVRYTLSKLWLRRPCPALLRGRNVARQFDSHIRAFKQSTLRRVQYYAKYLPPGPDGSEGPGDNINGSSGLERLRLYGVFCPTDHDHDVSHFVGLLHTHQLPQTAIAPVVAIQLSASRNADECGDAVAAEEGCSMQAAVDEARAAEPAAPRKGGGAGDSQYNLSVLPPEGFGSDGVCGNTSVRGSSCGADNDRQVGGPGVAAVSMEALTTAAAVAVAAVAADKAGGKRGWDGYGYGDGDRDGEAVLARYGFRLFWRGLSPQEWAARRQAEGALAAAMDGDGANCWNYDAGVTVGSRAAGELGLSVDM